MNTMQIYGEEQGISRSLKEGDYVSNARKGHWLSVVSHLDPKYGGLSAMVPQLASAVTQASEMTAGLAAFCARNECYAPTGYPELALSFWPTSRVAWMRDATLRSRMREEMSKADGVHLHGLWEQSTAVAGRMARELGKPYVVSPHGMLEPWALKSKRLKKLVYAALVERKNLDGAACLHALTSDEASHARRFGYQGPIAVIPNGVTVPLDLCPDLFLEKFSSLSGKRIFLFLSRLHPKKGLDLLVSAWAAVAKEWPEAHLVIAGPDFEGTRATIERQVNEHGLAERVTFTGMLADAMKWSALAAAECYVLPSYSEGLSMSALEAMGAGVPVIVTKPCNMPEVAEAGAGWVVEAEAAQLIEALSETLGQTPDLNASVGRRGSRLIRERFQWPAIARQMAEVYQWLQGGPAPTSVNFYEGQRP